MKVALLFGMEQGTALVPRLKGIKDNLDLEIFNDISHFIDLALKKGTIYDRIVLLSTKLSPTTLVDLHNYWQGTSRNTNIVLFAKTGQDEQKVKSFLDKFQSPVVAGMLVSTTTVNIVSEAVLKTTVDLNNQYGIKDFMKVELYNPEIAQPQPVQQSQPVQQPQTQPPKKKGFFGGLFGKKEKQVTPPQNQNTQPPQQYTQQSGNPEQFVPQNIPTGNKYENTINQNKTTTNSTINNTVQPQQQQYTENNFNTNYNPQDLQQQYYTQPQNYYQQPVYSQQQYNTMGTEPQASYNTQQGYYNQEPPQFSTQQGQPNATVQHETPNFSTPQEQPSYNTQQGYYSQEPPISNDTHYEQPNLSTQLEQPNNSFYGNIDTAPTVNNTPVADLGVQDDLSFTGITAPVTQDRQPSIPQITDEGFNSSVEEEASYRRELEAPKVVTQTVVKEIVRNVGGSNTVERILNGSSKKILVVTGDRGTGVTSTALSIATYMAKRCNVLYFDCDIENHGLLSYIDYSQFKNYDQSHLNGIKMCKTYNALQNCILDWDDNLYLLTSDYSCDATNDELSLTSEVVASAQQDFNLIVVDCPINKLEQIKDLLLLSQVVTCVEANKRGIMNMLCQLEILPLDIKYKRAVYSKGRLIATKITPNSNLPQLIKYIRAIYEPDDIDWLSQAVVLLNEAISDKLLNTLIEG